MSDVIKLSPDAEAWQHDIARFMDVGQEIETSQQLDFMAQLLVEFGQTAPRLEAVELKAIDRRIEEYPDRRVIPTALRRVTERQVIVMPRDSSSLLEIIGTHGRLKTPPDFLFDPDANAESANWATLWAGAIAASHTERPFIKKAEVENGRQPKLRTYGLRYKTADGRMLARPGYLETLLKRGDALMAEDGTVWTFPVMDVSHTSPDRVYKDPARLYEELDHIVSPESRLGVQVLHLLAGDPLNEDVQEITNEAVSELASNGSHNVIRGVTGVTRSDSRQFFRLSWWTMLALPDWHLAKGTSGLQTLAELHSID